jgi:hypothetical protein
MQSSNEAEEVHGSWLSKQLYERRLGSLGDFAAKICWLPTAVGFYLPMAQA